MSLKVTNEWRQLCHQKITGQLRETVQIFQVSELDAALKNMKSGNEAGYDDILP